MKHGTDSLLAALFERNVHRVRPRKLTDKQTTASCFASSGHETDVMNRM